MSASQRLFIGLAPDPATRLALQNLQTGLVLPDTARQVPSSNLHLTLAFLGQTPVSRQGELLELLAGMPLLTGEILLDCVGEFASAGVVWAGCRSPVKRLDDFAVCLRQGLGNAGFAFDPQPFRLHVTLYRKARLSSPQLISPPIVWPLAAPVLFASVSTPNGPEYHPLG